MDPDDANNRTGLLSDIESHINSNKIVTAEFLAKQPYLSNAFEKVGEPGADALSDCQTFIADTYKNKWNSFVVSKELNPTILDLQNSLLDIFHHLQTSTIFGLVELRQINE